MQKHDTLLKSILSQPTAPFRETHVVRTITHELEKAGVPHFLDPIGNIVVGASSKAEYLKLVKRKTDEPLRIYIAHLDHPGFHGASWLAPTRLETKWHGGTPTRFLEGAAVWLADDQGWFAEGHLTQVKLHDHGRAIDTAIVELPSDDRRDRHADAAALFGGFRFRAPFWEENDLVYTKAADDLVGAFAITTLGLDLLGGQATRKKKAPKPFLGLLTRAEEVGFIGAIGHFELGWLDGARRPLLAVSLETSRTLPGAEIGKGPVVRLGDRATVFSPGPLQVFTQLAEQLLPDRHQRRIMDGGSCEATAATAYGIPSIGISVPLGNYHNQSLEGGPDAAGPNGPAPEFVHRQDIEGLLTLCHGLLKPKLRWNDPWAARRKQFRESLRKYRPLLKA